MKFVSSNQSSFYKEHNTRFVSHSKFISIDLKGEKYPTSFYAQQIKIEKREAIAFDPIQDLIW